MTQRTILVVDDEQRLLRFLTREFRAEGFRVIQAKDGLSALAQLEHGSPDLVILDIMLPDIDGFEVCRRMRLCSDVPIIMLTARGGDRDELRGLEAGADDYLTKPFSVPKLVARIKAVLRRVSPGREAPVHQPYVCGDLTVDFEHRRVVVRGQEVHLRPTEYRLLEQLALNAGRVVLHNELLARVWGPEYRDEVEYLWVYIGYLRRQVEVNPRQPQYILTRSGVGYVLRSPDDPPTEDKEELATVFPRVS